MDLSNRIQFTNVPTFGTMHDAKLQKQTYAWINAAPNIPDNAWFFCNFTTNTQGATIDCMVTIEVGGKSVGTYSILGQTTCEQVLSNLSTFE